MAGIFRRTVILPYVIHCPLSLTFWATLYNIANQLIHCSR